MAVSSYQRVLVPGNPSADYCYFWTNCAPPGEALHNEPGFPTLPPHNLACPAFLHSLSSGRDYPTTAVQFGQGYDIDAAYHRGLRISADIPAGDYTAVLADAAGELIPLNLDAPINVRPPGSTRIGRVPIVGRTFNRQQITTQPNDRFDKCVFQNCQLRIGPHVCFTDCEFVGHNDWGHATETGHLEQSAFVWCRWLRTGRGMVMQPSVGPCSRNLFAWIVVDGCYSIPNGNEGWAVEATEGTSEADDNLLLHYRYVNSFGPAVQFWSGGKKLLARRNKFIDGLIVNGDVVLEGLGTGSDLVRNTFIQYHHDGGGVRVSGHCRLNDWYYPASTGYKPGVAHGMTTTEFEGQVEPYYPSVIFHAAGPSAASNWLDHPHIHAKPADCKKYEGFEVRNEISV